MQVNSVTPKLAAALVRLQIQHEPNMTKRANTRVVVAGFYVLLYIEKDLLTGLVVVHQSDPA
jgi:hypothetical protein